MNNCDYWSLLQAIPFSIRNTNKYLIAYTIQKFYLFFSHLSQCRLKYLTFLENLKQKYICHGKSHGQYCVPKVNTDLDFSEWWGDIWWYSRHFYNQNIPEVYLFVHLFICNFFKKLDLKLTRNGKKCKFRVLKMFPYESYTIKYFLTPFTLQ